MDHGLCSAPQAKTRGFVVESGDAPSGHGLRPLMFPVPSAHKEAKNEALHAAAYLRVSTEPQDLEHQKTAILRAAQARGDVIARWFEEKASGKKTDRAELTALRAAARAGEFRKVYVFAVDRLGRNGIRDIFRVVDELRHNGCAVASVSDPFDLDGPGGDMVLAVLAWVAQQELRRLGERIRAARANVEARGGRWGRPRRIDPGTLERARGLQSAGQTIRQIAVALKIPHSTLQRALAATGHYVKAGQ